MKFQINQTLDRKLFSKMRRFTFIFILHIISIGHRPVGYGSFKLFEGQFTRVECHLVVIFVG